MNFHGHPIHIWAILEEKEKIDEEKDDKGKLLPAPPN